MGKQKPKNQLSEADIRAVYVEGEEAVVSLVSQLLARLNHLEAEVKELKGRLGKNSRNSSKPPSGDGFGKRTRSLRRKSEKPSGGQLDHPGQTLEWCSLPEFVEVHNVESCSGCGQSLATVPVDEVLSRQVFDIPPIELLVTEHQAAVKCCPACGQTSQGRFPFEASNVVQYGPRLKGMMVYLMEQQLLPSNRTCECMSDLLGVVIAEGTLYNTRAQCTEAIAPLEAEIAQAIQAAEVVHFDETGLRVNQHLWWLHVAATDGLTYYFVHHKRGRLAMDEMGILPEFGGKAVHDGLQSYQGYNCEHFLCNAHHLRELQYVLDHYGQGWAFHLSVLLVSVHSQVKALKAQGKTALPEEDLVALSARYDAILDQGLRQNPMPLPDPTQPKKRGRPKRSIPRNLLERLQTHKAAVLGFMHNFDVPFDNNQAERDLRMMKLKQKISGCFRSEQGARDFCCIRGYLSTLRKQGLDVLDALVDLFSGNAHSLLPQPE
ncbi:MAG: IS66 family transposase [Phormidesmis sp. RL_2_1]|nr:IS66 family transposase [Phormidesmis sp. RL_2_1]